MTFVSLVRLAACGDVEAMLHFCKIISGGPIRPYHADSLEKALLPLIELWPVYLKPHEISKMILRSYQKALKKHYASNPNGPLPRFIAYFPQHHTLRYRTANHVVVTMDMSEIDPLILIQGTCYRPTFQISERAGTAPVSIDSGGQVFFPKEIGNMTIKFGDVCNFLRNRTPVL